MNKKGILITLVFVTLFIFSGCEKSADSDTGNIVATNTKEEKRDNLEKIAETYESPYDSGFPLVKNDENICYEMNEDEKTVMQSLRST